MNKTWDDVSDFWVNVGVARLLGLKVETEIDEGGFTADYHEKYPNTVWTAPQDEFGRQTDVWEQKVFTHSWEDMGPIISDSGISLIKWCEPDEGYEASIVNYYGHGSVYADVFYSHTTPLRAAAIVFLMMNGVKPDDYV